MKKFVTLLLVTVLLVVVTTATALPKVLWQDIIPDNIDVDTLTPVELASPKRPRTASSRILGGAVIKETDQPEFKHIVKILAYKPKGVFSCGGSIISDRVVVTAAHCLVSANEGEVFFGLRSQNDMYKAQSQEVYMRNFRIHDKWDQQTMANDIGLIVLPKKITFSASVGAIGVPLPNTPCGSYVNMKSIIAGWGQTSDADGSSSDILKTSTVKIDNQAQCKTNYGYKFNPDKMICVDASNNSGTCKGDSGGPLVIKDESNKQTLIGIVSYGAVGCVQKKSRVFTCISAYAKWIADNSK